MSASGGDPSGTDGRADESAAPVAASPASVAGPPAGPFVLGAVPAAPSLLLSFGLPAGAEAGAEAARARALVCDFLSGEGASLSIATFLPGDPLVGVCFRELLCEGEGVEVPAPALRVASLTAGVPLPVPFASGLRAGCEAFAFAGPAFFDVVASPASALRSAASSDSTSVVMPPPPLELLSRDPRGPVVAKPNSFALEAKLRGAEV